MTKRESGWYRVFVSWTENAVLMEWDAHTQRWFGYGYYDGDSFEDGDVQCHDEEMIMTPSGQIVYNQPAHDPLYNTKQEG
ncbi:MAG: hypothetical protein ACRDCI_12000 [Plesiomonas shigelloides]